MLGGLAPWHVYKDRSLGIRAGHRRVAESRATLGRHPHVEAKRSGLDWDLQRNGFLFGPLLHFVLAQLLWQAFSLGVTIEECGAQSGWHLPARLLRVLRPR